jgi:hypothetical protein
MDYGRVLRRAVEITWRHKALWLFGFLLALFGGTGGGGGGQGLQYRIGQTELARPEWAWGLALLVIALVFVFVVAAIVLSNISRGALIGMVRETEETGNTSARNGWRIGKSRLWSLIGIDLVTVIPAVIAAMALIALALSPLLLLLAERDALTVLGVVLTVLLSLGVVVVIIIAGTMLGIVREFAYRQSVLEGRGVWLSIRAGYRIVRAHLRTVGVMWLLLFGIDLAASVIAFPLLLVGFGLAASAGAAVYAASESVAGAIAVALLLGVPAALISALVGGVYLVFRSSAWTLAYREVQAESSLA